MCPKLEKPEIPCNCGHYEDSHDNYGMDDVYEPWCLICECLEFRPSNLAYLELLDEDNENA